MATKKPHPSTVKLRRTRRRCARALYDLSRIESVIDDGTLCRDPQQPYASAIRRLVVILLDDGDFTEWDLKND
jgi:hypothetical protein